MYFLIFLKIIYNLQIDIVKDELGKLDGAYYIKKTSNNFTTILSTVILLFYKIKNTIDHARHFTKIFLQIHCHWKKEEVHGIGSSRGYNKLLKIDLRVINELIKHYDTKRWHNIWNVSKRKHAMCLYITK